MTDIQTSGQTDRHPDKQTDILLGDKCTSYETDCVKIWAQIFQCKS